MAMIDQIRQHLGDKADFLLNHTSKTISKDQLHLPSGDAVSREFIGSDRNNRVLRNLQWIADTVRDNTPNQIDRCGTRMSILS